MRYPIKVSCNKNTPTKIYKKLKKFGLYDTGNHVFCGVASAWKLNRIRRFSKQCGLSFKINNSLGIRTDNYRYVYFKKHKPINGQYYLCAYCGRKLTRRLSTVDHIIPIAKAAQSVTVQKALFRAGIADINDPRNLTISCERCNKKKGTHMGLWIIRGLVGRNTTVRIALNVIKAIVKTALIIYILYIVLVVCQHFHFNFSVPELLGIL